MFILLMLIIFISGCVSQGGVWSSDAGLTVEVMRVPDSIMAGVPFDIEVVLTNNAGIDINNVIITMSDPTDFTILETDCDGIVISNQNGCYGMNPPWNLFTNPNPFARYTISPAFSLIEKDDGRVVTFRMEAPNNDGTFNPILTVSFDFQGTTIMQLPIVNRDARVDVGGSYQQSEGPIQLNLVRTGDDAPGDFVYGKGVFALEMDFEDINADSDVKINSGELEIILTNFVVYNKNDCKAFNVAPASLPPPLPGGGDRTQTITLDKQIKVSDEDPLTCVLQSPDANVWKYGGIEAKYKYRYETSIELGIEVTKLP